MTDRREFANTVEFTARHCIGAGGGVLIALPDEYDGELNNPALDLLLDPAEVATPSMAAIAWLLANGVPIEAVTRFWAIGAARVIAIDSVIYMPCPIGDFAYVFACQTVDGVSDLAAWQPSSGRLMLRRGLVGLLGQRQAEEAHDDIAARPVRVWRTPLAWLRAGRSGCVVINPEIAAHILGGLPVGAEDESHAHALSALRVPAPRARVHAEWELVS
jgi:hypothetical protein